MQFKWITAPETTFAAGMDAWTELLMGAIHVLLIDEAVRCEEFMRINAPWVDECMPDKEYLRAFAYRDDDAMQLGIIAYVDEDMYRENCPGRAVKDWQKMVFLHEVIGYNKRGTELALILPAGGKESVMGTFADEVWAKVVKLLESPIDSLPTTSAVYGDVEF